MIQPEIKVLPDPAAVAHEAAERVVDAAAEAIALADRFSLVLAGGSTPKALYELLASPPFQDRIDWTRVEIYFGDERTVPPDHPDSNYRMASESLLTRVPIEPENVHRMRGEIDPNDAAISYGRLLKEKFPSTGSGQAGDAGPDLVLLGMGDDGHTASLFPDTEALKETKHRAVANRVEKLGTWRITLSAPFINSAREVMVLVAGAGKAARLAEVLEGPRDPQRLPVQLIAPSTGKLIWLVDAAAAGMHENDAQA